MKRVILLVIALSLVWFVPSGAQTLRVLRPVDEAASNPGFLAFRTRLQAAIAKHDTAALMEIVDPEIRVSFGSDQGVRAFTEMWKPRAPASALWRELGAVLALGGTFTSPSNFTAPYVFSRWPEGVDSFEYVAVVGTNVRVRAEPRIDSRIIASVSYVILRLENESRVDEGRGWRGINFNGRKAYVSTRYVRSPVDYRANFTFSRGRWLMNFFLSGD